MFKIGQKVVCVSEFLGLESYDNGKTWVVDARSINPTVGEVVTIKDISPFNGYLVLHGYPITYYYDHNKFRPLDESFAEVVLEEITRQIEEEELVLT